MVLTVAHRAVAVEDMVEHMEAVVAGMVEHMEAVVVAVEEEALLYDYVYKS